MIFVSIKLIIVYSTRKIVQFININQLNKHRNSNLQIIYVDIMDLAIFIGDKLLNNLMKKFINTIK